MMWKSCVKYCSVKRNKERGGGRVNEEATIRHTWLKRLSNYSADVNMFGPYEYNEELEEAARKGLITFYEMLTATKIKPMEYDSGRFHTAYLLQLIPIKKAFDHKQYRLVCHELETLLYYEPFSQPRIWYNILDLLKSNLDIKEGL